MVQINQRLKQGFEQQYGGSTVTALASGTELGLQKLQQGALDVAGISRSLTTEETQAGLKSVAIARDAIALVIGVNNPYSGSLSPQQVVDIFQGRVTNWNQVGGPDAPIRVINRPPISGTHQAFQELVLAGGDFGTGPTITTLERDATTPMLRALGTDGIGYATYAQVATQQTVRVVPVDGRSPQDRNYAFQRVLAYAYPDPINTAAAAFLGYVLSDAGQAAITTEP
jgi:phosphate transport system substrate-binding protein